MPPTTSAPKTISGPNAIPVVDRQILTSQMLRELRVACALIVKETGPTGAELEAILNQPDPLDTYNKEVAKVRAKASSTQQSAFVKSLRPRDRSSKSNLVSVNQSTTTLPLSRPRSNVYTSNHRSTSALPQTVQKVEPVPLDRPVTLDKQVTRKSVPARDQDALAKIQSSMNLRPKTSAAASVDYVAATAGSSGSTTRSNTTFEPRISTNVTSLNQTPADDKRGSYQFPKRSSSRSASAQGWRRDEAPGRQDPVRDLSLPNPDYAVPLIQHARAMPTPVYASREPSRPPSRASSFKNAVIGGIRDYIQPRPSLERLSRSSSRNESVSGSRASSRPPSRGSSFSQSSRGWIKNAANGLRRKGSFSSWKPNRPEDEEQQRTKRKGPDLNRNLPPLPGLDSYKEPKVHIAQMMLASPTSTQPSATLKSPVQQPSAHKNPVQPVRSQKSPEARGSANPDHRTMQLSPSVPGAVPKSTKKPSVPANPRSPGQPASMKSSIGSPRSDAPSFPRIPFSDDYPIEISQIPTPTRATHSTQNALERQKKESERRRQRQERSKETRSKETKGNELDKKEEEAIRREVRERIMRGGLSMEAFNAEDEDRQPLAAMEPPTNSPEQTFASETPGATSKHRERHRKLEREGRIENEEAQARSRAIHVDKTNDTNARRTLKSRLSRLLKHDSGLGQGHGNAIVAS